MSEPVAPRLPLSAAGLWRLVKPLLARLLRVRALWVVVGCWLLFEILGASCTTYVPPNMMAIKQVYFGSQAGMRPERYGPGLHFVVSGIERLHFFPADLQVVNLSDSSSETSAQFRSAPSIKIQTSDGYNVQLDVTLLSAFRTRTRSSPKQAPGERSRTGWSSRAPTGSCARRWASSTARSSIKGRAASRRPTRRTSSWSPSWRRTASPSTPCWSGATSTTSATSS